MTTERELVLGVLSGEDGAWSELVRRYAPLVWSVARRHRLTTADAADVAQNTWLATAQNLRKLRDPERLAGWIATTARRECLNLLAHGCRETPADWFDAPEVPERGPEPLVLRSARDQLLWRAFASLPERCRALLGLLAHAPGLTYAQVSRALGINVNSVGQTRGRCLEVLRRRLAILDIREESAG
ncbi:sigma-70 family RNA polymerase sigma factor [Actinophytocola sp.]|uniref:RNA polymerase sigma factor n=1 Tax=Actinophytocola sp. TaxID=1872138 RepID=UPI002EDAF313